MVLEEWELYLYEAQRNVIPNMAEFRTKMAKALDTFEKTRDYYSDLVQRVANESDEFKQEFGVDHLADNTIDCEELAEQIRGILAASEPGAANYPEITRRLETIIAALRKALL